METSVVNRIDQVFEHEAGKLLNVYFTAGYPKLEDTVPVASSLAKHGADLIEIGLPFSDPIADGPTIQESSDVALANGMTLRVLFEQLQELRPQVQVPVLLMGYINPILQFGFERFCAKCQEVGIDGLILPDLPMHEYLTHYKAILDAHGLYNIFLITPQTSPERIQEIDANSKGFIYMVSSASITGAKSTITETQVAYFERIKAMKLTRHRLIGFGISSHQTFEQACAYADGAIIGSAFIKQLAMDSSEDAIKTFIQDIKNG
ncbi:MAG: tryptophan synthase subunit alpha [Bacteroidota bacterium]